MGQEIDFPISRTWKKHYNSNKIFKPKKPKEYTFRNGEYKNKTINEVLKKIDGGYVGWWYSNIKNNPEHTKITNVLDTLIENYIGEIEHKNIPAEDMYYTSGDFQHRNVNEILNSKNVNYVMNLITVLTSSGKKEIYSKLYTKLTYLENKVMDDVKEVVNKDMKQIQQSVIK